MNCTVLSWYVETAPYNQQHVKKSKFSFEFLRNDLRQKDTMLIGHIHGEIKPLCVNNNLHTNAGSCKRYYSRCCQEHLTKCQMEDMVFGILLALKLAQFEHMGPYLLYAVLHKEDLL